ncbi:MAG: curli-like amyloid fiber formation chaperone CsgH [Methylocystis sp.]|uniref:curli-like amyloid fiber formation chaperone CsgH n=1 Tax=Methylocystis sp. TaxID=1911079 RepID=UPI003DA62C39
MDAIDPPAIQCSVDAEHQRDHVSLRGRIVGASAASGSYRLEIQSQSPSGRSMVTQAGQFKSEADEPVFVGAAHLSMAAGTRLVARLSVHVDQLSCNAEREISDE